MRQSFTLVTIFLAISTLGSCMAEKEALPTPTVPGPTVMGKGTEIETWNYFGPDATQSIPAPSSNIRDVGNEVYEARLIQTENGFDIVWGQMRCATQPTVIVYADATIEFWPGDIVGEDCEAAELFHKLTVTWHTNVPFGQWDFIFHPPQRD